MYIYICIHTHTHTHTHIYIYIRYCLHLNRCHHASGYDVIMLSEATQPFKLKQNYGSCAVVSLTFVLFNIKSVSYNKAQ